MYIHHSYIQLNSIFRLILCTMDIVVHDIDIHDYYFYYDLRFIILVPINMFLRPHFSLFFSDYTTSFNSFMQVFLLALASFVFLFTSLNFKVPRSRYRYRYRYYCYRLVRDGGGLLLIRVGYGERSVLVTFAFIFSLFCPTLGFLYLHPWIVLSSLCPSLLNLFHRLFLRFRAAFSTFLA